MKGSQSNEHTYAIHQLPRCSASSMNLSFLEVGYCVKCKVYSHTVTLLLPGLPTADTRDYILDCCFRRFMRSFAVQVICIFVFCIVFVCVAVFSCLSCSFLQYFYHSTEFFKRLAITIMQRSISYHDQENRWIPYWRGKSKRASSFTRGQ